MLSEQSYYWQLQEILKKGPAREKNNQTSWKQNITKQSQTSIHLQLGKECCPLWQFSKLGWLSIALQHVPYMPHQPLLIRNFCSTLVAFRDEPVLHQRLKITPYHIPSKTQPPSTHEGSSTPYSFLFKIQSEKTLSRYRNKIPTKQITIIRCSDLHKCV